MVHRRLLTTALAVVAGCASSDPPAATPASTAVPAAIDFTAPAVGGGEIDVRAYAGRDLALWFWAPY